MTSRKFTSYKTIQITQIVPPGSKPTIWQWPQIFWNRDIFFGEVPMAKTILALVVLINVLFRLWS